MALSDLLQGFLTSVTQSRYNKNVTRLTTTTQGFSNIVITALLEQPCNKSDNINKVVTTC